QFAGADERSEKIKITLRAPGVRRGMNPDFEGKASAALLSCLSRGLALRSATYDPDACFSLAHSSPLGRQWSRGGRGDVHTVPDGVRLRTTWIWPSVVCAHRGLRAACPRRGHHRIPWRLQPDCNGNARATRGFPCPPSDFANGLMGLIAGVVLCFALT